VTEMASSRSGVCAVVNQADRALSRPQNPRKGVVRTLFRVSGGTRSVDANHGATSVR